MKENCYHDYVIKDGRFTGRFEEMYQDCRDPWRQDGDMFVFKYLSLRLLGLLGYTRFGRILDMGCGKGKFTAGIKEAYPDARVTGIDISATAVKEASRRYKDIDFVQADVMNDELDYSEYNCIFMTELLWYILPRMKDLFIKINDGLRMSGGVFVLNNHLYRDSEQSYGREYVTTIETLVSRLPFRIEYLLENNRLNNYDVTLICRSGS